MLKRIIEGAAGEVAEENRTDKNQWENDSHHQIPEGQSCGRSKK